MTNKTNKLFWYVPMIILVLGILGMPYGYYLLLRIVVCTAAGYLAYCEYALNQWSNWAITFGLIAILFNPLFMVFLTRPIWFFIDIICIYLFFSHLKIYFEVKK